MADAFVYSFRYPEKPPVAFAHETFTRSCKRCGAQFTTTSRTKERCDPCRVVRRLETVEKANTRLRKKRAAARL